MKRILVVEDEPNIRELILYNLIQNEYEGMFAEDGITGLTMAIEESPDLILLDIMLPGKNGYDICRELRSSGNKVPIIMLTAKSDEIDKVLGLEFGADDYITKPFGIRELMARIKAVLRRYETDVTQEQTGSRKTSKNSTEFGKIIREKNILRIDDLTIDIERHEVKLSDRVIELTLKEFDLLKTLVENRGCVMNREQLLDKIWGFDYVGETRTVDVHVRYLRKKLEGDEKESRYIQTVRGIGYKVP